MKIFLRLLLLFTLCLIVFPSPTPADPGGSSILGSPAFKTVSDPPVLVAQISRPYFEEGENPEWEEWPDTIHDPLEPANRIFFHVNDKLYFAVVKPMASGYKAVVPEDLRIGVRNFFSNLTTPARLVNCLLQAKFKGAGNEMLRFLLNSTLGLAGFLDPARKELGIEKKDEDFGQTLGFWGIGPVFYIEWPLLGGSSLRDTFGYTGDLLLDPKIYLIGSVPLNLAIRTYDQVNDISFRIGEYEDFKKNVLDPYIAKREAYHQNRKYKIKN
jgi:phospholipid-binding lipoprotein MlaA